MTITLAICFYRDVDVLLRTLDSIAAQIRRPDEIVIADDGSDEAVGVPIAEWANKRKVSLIHAWHPKDGFRQSEMRNKAAFVATSEFVSFIDHDCLLPRGFIRSHLKFANERHLQLGPRIDVMPPTTVNFRPVMLPILRGLAARRLFGWKTAIRGDKLLPAPPDVIHGCNLLAPKSMINAINGFDEDFKSWGYEDADFVVRAWRAGHGIGLSGYGTAVFHLYHPSRADLANLSRFKASVAQSRVRCENGISKHNGVALQRTVQGFYTRAVFPK
ncbi:MAG TPA: glycosyltransferase [Opitutaceae bacterium]|nr:glycosyltransferase [Opitutaceae bacterium]